MATLGRPGDFLAPGRRTVLGSGRRAWSGGCSNKGAIRTSSAALAAIGDIDPALYALAEPRGPGGAVGIFAISDLTHTTTSSSAASPA
ncbi:hypothetical protein [Cellulomonas soli]|uniref:Uncharacterized protein n=1 Tax=Cellulomonas soli TaxID=931535 RepID=A0A512PCQ2_9CELL|nr:hypothetical protein [Cellulomonas soli]NYI58564.1 hypothetical protein [Cellulomonas soli]GEP68989.1 hypothetical protein CSO01_17040 [Cellulomonas soli]